MCLAEQLNIYGGQDPIEIQLALYHYNSENDQGQYLKKKIIGLVSMIMYMIDFYAIYIVED